MASQNHLSLELITFDDFCSEMTAAKTAHATDSNLYNPDVDNKQFGKCKNIQ